MWRSGDVVMERVRARVPESAPGTDQQVAMRLKLAQLLAGADLYPREMPPSAILLVRELKDPLPGRMLREPGANQVDPEWERAVRSLLADLWRSAARPDGQGRIPPEAEALLFADQAELLACAAAELVRGAGQVAWWFTGLLERGARASGQPVKPALLLRHDARCLPVILDRLTEWGLAEEVMIAVAPTEAMALLAAICREFRISEGQIYLALSGTGAATEAVPLESAQGQALSRPGQLPFAPAEQQLLQRLSRERRLLWGLAVTMARQPRAAQSVGALPPLLRALLAEAPVASVEPGQHLTVSPADGEQNQAYRQTVSRDRSEAPTPAPGAAAVAGSESAAPEADLVPGRMGLTTPGPAPGAAAATAGSPGAQPAADLSTPPAHQAAQDPGLATRLAGLFYLLNLLPRLELVPPEELGPWPMLEALGRGLLADLKAEWLEWDPIWKALLELDGREPHQPLGPPHDPHLERWLAEALPPVQAALLAALRLEQPTEIPGVLLLAPGQLYITRTHIDVVMPLDYISLPVRMAGLDTDPGWLPAWGRAIHFHFR